MLRSWIPVLTGACVTFLFLPTGSALAWPRLTSVSNTDVETRRGSLHRLADRSPAVIYVRAGNGHHRGPTDDPYALESYFKKRKALKDAASKPHVDVAAPAETDQRNHSKVRAKATPFKVSAPERSRRNPSEKHVYPSPSSEEKKSKLKIVEPNTVTEPVGGAE